MRRQSWKSTPRLPEWQRRIVSAFLYLFDKELVRYNINTPGGRALGRPYVWRYEIRDREEW